jgi:hypothetical protein
MSATEGNVIFLAYERQRRVAAKAASRASLNSSLYSEVAPPGTGGPCILCGTHCGPGEAWASDEAGYVCSVCLDVLHGEISQPR